MFLIKEETFSVKRESTDLQMRTLRLKGSCLLEKCVRGEIYLCGKNRAKYNWGAFCTWVRNKLGGTFIGYESLVSIFKILWVTYIHHTYIHTYIHTRICLHACLHTYTHTYTYLHIHIHKKRVYAHMRACTHAYIYIYAHTHTHTHTHTHIYVHTHKCTTVCTTLSSVCRISQPKFNRETA
jgi:hypothetical protein